MNQPLNIQVSSIPSTTGEITLLATYIAPDGVNRSSSATFKADNQGKIALASLAPLSGSYYGIDPIGLFWSMAPIPREQNLTHPNFDKQEISIEVMEGAKKVAETTIVRRILSPSVEKKENKENGLVGTLFTPKGNGPFPGVIVIPGAQGGIPENHAALLASQGFVTFALAYHGFEGLSPWLFNIPVEYLKTGFSFLKDQEKVNKESLGIIGNSKGAEFALLYASTFPDDGKATVGYMTPSVALSVTPLPCWLQEGKSIQPLLKIYTNLHMRRFE